MKSRYCSIHKSIPKSPLQGAHKRDGRPSGTKGRTAREDGAVRPESRKRCTRVLGGERLGEGRSEGRREGCERNRTSGTRFECVRMGDDWYRHIFKGLSTRLGRRTIEKRFENPYFFHPLFILPKSSFGGH